MTRITRWNPFREMVEMQRQMDRIFEDVGRAVGDGEWSAVGKWLALDVHDNGEAYTVQADLPGMNPDDIDITLHENTLTISGEFMQPEAPEGTQNVLNERRYGSFRRSITLPNAIDADNVEANYEDGVLQLTIPKSEAAKPRQISVKPGKMLESSNN
jgi:HSP20 family protein